MPFKTFFRWDLRSLILLLTLITALVTLLNSFHASYRVQYQLLIDNALEANHAYASKLASSTETYLQASQQQLAYAAGLMARDFANIGHLNDEAARLRLQTNTFNSIVITDARGQVLATSPRRGVISVIWSSLARSIQLIESSACVL